MARLTSFLAVALFLLPDSPAVSQSRRSKGDQSNPPAPVQGQGYRQTDSLGGGPAQPAEGGKFRVFILAGQSNMTGHGQANELVEPYNRPHDRIRVWAHGRWEYLVPSKNFGPGVGMAHQLADFWPDDTIGIIKVAIGGTGILSFVPDWSYERANLTRDGHKGSLYKDIIDSVTAAREVSDFQLAGFVWKQGGKDSKRADLGDEYLDNFKKMIAGLRKDLAAPELPVFVATYASSDQLDELLQKYGSGRPGLVAVLRAHNKASEVITHTTTVVHGRLPLKSDGIHFNTEGQLKLGKIIADAVEEYYTEKR